MIIVITNIKLIYNFYHNPHFVFLQLWALAVLVLVNFKGKENKSFMFFVYTFSRITKKIRNRICKLFRLKFQQKSAHFLGYFKK